MNEKKIGTSFKIDPTVLSKLNEEARKAEISLNSLVNQICKQHVDWHSTAAQAGVGTILKPMLKLLLDQLDDAQIRNLAKKIAKEEWKDFIMLLTHEYSIRSALKLIETWLKVVKYPYSYEQNGDEHRFYIHHDMGKKYSIYLSSLYENGFEEFKTVKSEFKISENSISFVVNIIKSDSPLVVNDKTDKLEPSPDSLMNNEIVALSIEETLLEISKEAFDTVSDKLYNYYNCTISDCYENPEYLQRILKDLYGNGSRAITDKIKKWLEEHAKDEKVSHFVKVVCK